MVLNRAIKQTSSEVFMIRPASFRMNEETAVNNYYQQADESLSSEEIREGAIQEFDKLVDLLLKEGVNVRIFQDKDIPKTPDAIFPNNWISTHREARIVLYPMFAENRRLERRTDILEKLRDYGFIFEEIIDLSHYEKDGKFLEGTGSMVLDRQHKFAYISISERSDKNLANELCQYIGYTPIFFHSFQNSNGTRQLIYHTNVVMSVGERLALIGLDCIDDKDERAHVQDVLHKSGKHIIPLSEDQITSFAGNMLELSTVEGTQLLAMSSQAYSSLKKGQIDRIQEFVKIVHSPLNLIENLVEEMPGV